MYIHDEQPAARRANIDFERSERERIHFETATRVLNYEIAAERAEAKEKTTTLSPQEAKRQRLEALNKDFVGQIDPRVSYSILFIFFLSHQKIKREKRKENGTRTSTASFFLSNLILSIAPLIIYAWKYSTSYIRIYTPGESKALERANDFFFHEGDTRTPASGTSC